MKQIFVPYMKRIFCAIYEQIFNATWKEFVLRSDSESDVKCNSRSEAQFSIWSEFFYIIQNICNTPSYATAIWKPIKRLQCPCMHLLIENNFSLNAKLYTYFKVLIRVRPIISFRVMLVNKKCISRFKFTLKWENSWK